MIKFPQATMSMEAEGGANSGGAVEEPVRKKIAERDWINDDGEVASEEEATAVRYTFLEDGKHYTHRLESTTPRARMLEGFGALTLMGNVTNTWKIEKGDRAASPVDSIGERFALLSAGQWIDRSAGAVGAKLDKDALANAVVDVAQAAGKTVDMATVRQKLEDDPVFVRTVRKVPAINQRYAELVGTQVKSIDDVLGAI